MAATGQNQKWSFYKQTTRVKYEGEFWEGELWLTVSDW